MNKLADCGVVGCGFVGSAVARGFSTFANISTYDVDPRKCTNSLVETLNNQFVFVCLPSPMDNPEGGDCDLSIIEGFFDEAHHLLTSSIPLSHDPIFVLKSTVPVGTTMRLNDKYHDDIVIVHNPEFLTARCALIDFITPARNIVGGENEDAVFEVAELLRSRFPGIPCFEMSSQESEFVKYMANCFFATKVMFFNEMRLLSDHKNMNWGKVLEGVLSDGRIGKSHYQVPGHDGQTGYGGTCVTPDAKVRIKMTIQDEIDNYIPEEYDPEIITISELYDRFQKRSHTWGIESFQIESCNFNCTEQEWKCVDNVTVREVDEEIIVIETEYGIFRCTSDHLIPVLRNNEQILIRAEAMRETDEIFLKEGCPQQASGHHDYAILG